MYWINGVDGRLSLDNPLIKWDKQYQVLLNTYPSTILIPPGYSVSGFRAQCVYQAWIAAKAKTREDGMRVLNATTSTEIRNLSNKISPRDDWSLHELPLLRELMIRKFMKRWTWKRILKSTEPRVILHRDLDTRLGVVWDGVDTWVGSNLVGNILMEFRSYLLDI